MPTDRILDLPTNIVMALFTTGVTSFSLPEGATFGDLADSLDHIGDQRSDLPTAVFLRLGQIGQPASALYSGI